MNENKSVLIFGVSGFVGHHLAEEFRANGYKVSGCDVGRSPSVPEYVDFYEGDILDAEKTAGMVAEASPGYIVNLAAISSVGQSWRLPGKTVAVNVEGAVNILEAVRKSGISAKTLLIGSSEEYAFSDRPISERGELNGSNPYGISKIMQERFAQLYRDQYGMDVFYVRSFNHTGPGQSDRFVIPSWCKQVAEISRHERSAVMHIGNTHVKRDFSDVRDVARAYRLILEKGDCSQTYNVGSGRLVELNDILAHILSFSSVKIDVKVDDQLIRSNEAEVIWCDNSLIKRDVGWVPAHDIFDTIREIYNQY